MRRGLRFALFVVLLAAMSAYLYAHRRYADRHVVPPGATPVLAHGGRTPARTTGAPAVAIFALARDDAQSAALDDPRAPASARRGAGEAYVALTRTVEQEGEVESLLRAKGFADVAVLIAHGRAEVVVASLVPLRAEQVAEIAYTVGEVTGLPPTSIAVIRGS
jgi:hypothetical protein